MMLLLALAACVAASETQLRIFLFQMGQADSQLWVFPSGFSVLIDVGEDPFDSTAGAEKIANELVRILGKPYVDVGVPTHGHADHMGYYGDGGFYGLITRFNVTFGKILDRNSGVWVGPSSRDNCNSVNINNIDFANAGDTSGTIEKWICWATDKANTNIQPLRETAVVGSVTQIRPPDANALVEVFGSDAQGVYMENGRTPVFGDNTNAANPPSENDYCISLRLTFGNFSHFTAGDTSGYYYNAYNDVETVLAERWLEKGYPRVDTMTVNHHGSAYSSNPFYLQTLNPAAAIISCGFNSPYGHPAQATLDRLFNPTLRNQLYLLNICDRSRDYEDAIIADATLVIETDGTTFSLYAEEDTGPVFDPAALRLLGRYTAGV